MKNAGGPGQAIPSHPHATLKPSAWEGIATHKPPSCDPRGGTRRLVGASSDFGVWTSRPPNGHVFAELSKINSCFPRWRYLYCALFLKES